MIPTELKQELKRRKISQVDIAEDLGKSPAAVSLVINGKSRSKLIEEHIAKLLGHRRFDLWEPTRSVEPGLAPRMEDSLYLRLLALLESAPATDLPVVSFQQVPNDRNMVRQTPFIVDMLDSDEEDAAQRVNQWLDTPNPLFGDKCPRAYMCGSEEERSFVERIVGAIEQGSFS